VTTEAKRKSCGVRERLITWPPGICTAGWWSAGSDKTVTHKLFAELASASRPAGGYTRIIKLGHRRRRPEVPDRIAG